LPSVGTEFGTIPCGSEKEELEESIEQMVYHVKKFFIFATS